MIYKALIVDDEPMILKGLKKIIPWEEFGIEIRGEAGNGEAALEIAKIINPDIVITDIRMPGMNGLELIDKLNKLENKPYIIILSGYDDFNLVKKALQCRVENYILKPINKEELIFTIENIVERIEEKQENKYQSETTSIILRNNILNRLLRGQISEREFTERAQMYNIVQISGSAFCVIIQSKLKAAIENDIRIHISKYFHKETYICFQDIKGYYNLIFYGRDLFKELAETEKKLEKVKSCLLENNNIPAIISIGKIVNGIDELKFSYMTAKKGLKSLKNKKSGLIRVEEKKHYKTESLYELDMKSDSRCVNQVIEYIHLNYKKPISLKIVAPKYILTAAYLGKIFKMKTGFVFTDYLNYFRIIKSQKLLCQTQDRVMDIACQVGYSGSENYFYTIFKKQTTMTPVEYRNEFS